MKRKPENDNGGFSQGGSNPKRSNLVKYLIIGAIIIVIIIAFLV